jgi:homoserine dehydrogenase
MFPVDLALVGFGNVGRRFVRLLQERSDDLCRHHGLDWRIVGIATRRHGVARNPGGLDPDAAIALVEGGGSLDALGSAARVDTASRPGRPMGVEFIAQVAAEGSAPAQRHLVIVETTLLDIVAGQPAIDHVRAALGAGAHVLTANKGPIAFAYAELAARARSAGRVFLFEGAVMDGIPIFNLVRETLPVARIDGFRGVLNSTTNYILTAMEEGREFDEALAEMQRAGVAEADASLDVDGWDAAAKAAALANVLMGARVTPPEVDRTGIGHVGGADARAAVGRGRRVKLVARAERRGENAVVRVRPEELPQADLLATLRNQQNALVLETDLLGEFAIVQLGGGLTQTAYALLSDLVSLGRLHR